MNRVFVTQEMTQFDYAPAEAFGEVQFLAVRDWSPIAGSIHNEELLAGVRRRLADYNPEHDYIVTTGSPVVIAVVFMVLAQRPHRQVRILKWSNRDRVYAPITIEV
jgi:hypothetical protein